MQQNVSPEPVSAKLRPPLCRILLGLFCLWAWPLQLSAESAESANPPTGHDWIKIDGPQIDLNSWLTLNAMASSPLANLRDQALDSIEQAIRNGQTGPGDPNLVNLLADVCLTPLVTIPAPGTAPRQDLPLIRIRAIRMGSLLGGDAAYSLLLQVLEVELEPAVLAEAHAALQKLLRLPSEREIALIVAHLQSNFPNGPHNALMLELLSDVQAYHQRWNMMARSDVFDAVMKLSQDRRYLQRVRSGAENTLKVLLGLQ